MKKLPIYLIIGLFILIGLKGCIITTISFDDYISGTLNDQDGQSTRAIITPENELFIAKRYENITEVGIYKINGIYATKYFSSAYHFKSLGTFPFGVRFFKRAEKVLDSDLKLIYKEGESFPDVGETFKGQIVIYKDHFDINNDRWNIFSLNSNEKSEMTTLLKIIRETIK